MLVAPRSWVWLNAASILSVLGCGASFSSGSGLEGGVDATQAVDAATGRDAATTQSDAQDDVQKEAQGDAQGDAESDAPAASCGPGMPCVGAVTGAETCCISPSGKSFTSACAVAQSCPAASDIALHCISKSDCLATQVCCIQPQGNGAVSSCTALVCTGNAKRICNLRATAPDCPAAGTCSNDIGGGVTLPPDIGGCSN